MSDERMRFVLEGRDNLSRAFEQAGQSASKLQRELKAVGASAAIPAAAAGASAALSLGAAVGAAAVALGAFGAAIGPQAKAMGEVSKAQEKYKDAVASSGLASEEAAKAELAYLSAVQGLPPATREAAAGLSVLKETYQEWSDSLADDTMPVLTKSFGVFSATLPKLTPLVKGTSAELDRLMNVLGGMAASPALDGLISKLTEFSSSVLHRATTEIANLSRTLGQMDTGPLDRFLAMGEEHGPLVAETLKNVALALANVLTASSGVGVAVLKVADALARLVNAIPPEALAAMIQVYAALRLIAVATAAVTAASTVAAARLAVMGRALTVIAIEATTAGGAIAGLRAGFAALSTTAKVGIIAGAVIGIAMAVNHFAEEARGAPPDVDKLTTSLKKLAVTGEATGELKKSIGGLKGLGDAFRTLSVDAKQWGKVQDQFGSNITKSIRRTADLADSFNRGGDSAKAAREKFSSLDESLANMVQSGHADTAATAFSLATAGLRAQGVSVDEIKAKLPGYRAALEAAEVANELAAEGMGIFGDQALKTKAKLDAQKMSAVGLRQAIIALNETNRDAYDAQIAFEQGVDSLTAAFKENGATLNLNTEAGRANGKAMSTAAAAHDEMIASGVAAGESLAVMTGKSGKLRTEMLRLAESTNMSDKEAREYVNTLLGTPGDIKTMVKLEREDALAGLKSVQREIRETPGRKKVKVDTLNAAAIAALEDVGLKTRRLPDGRTEVRTTNGQSLGAIGAVNQAMNNIDGKTSRTFVKTFYTSIYRSVREDMSFSPAGPGVRANAQGGMIRGYATGGGVGGGFVSGPGTATSDSIPALLSDGEYVIRAATVSKFGEQFFDMLNAGTLPMAKTVMGSERALHQGGKGLGDQVATGLKAMGPAVREAAAGLAAAVTGQLRAAAPDRPKSGYDIAVSQLNRLVDSGRWRKKGSKLFEDVSFQGMSDVYRHHQDAIADDFWSAIQEIQKATASGKRVHEDMTFKGMSANVSRFHDAIAQIWKGNPYGSNFGDWGNFGKYQQYTGPQVRVPAQAAAAAPAPVPHSTTYNVYPQRANFGVHDLEALQRRSDVRARVGRPR